MMASQDWGMAMAERLSPVKRLERTQNQFYVLRVYMPAENYGTH